MNAELAAAIRADFGAMRDRWVEYLLALENSPYRERLRAELDETVGRSLEAWVLVLEGREEALSEFVRFIVAYRMELGFPLSEIHRANIGFRVVLEPLIETRYADPAAAVQAYRDAVAV